MTSPLSAHALMDRVAVVHDVGIDVFVAEMDPDQADVLIAQLRLASRLARDAAGLLAPI